MNLNYETTSLNAGAVIKPAARQENRLRGRLFGLVSLIRPLFFVLTPVNAASAAVMAYGGFPPLAKCLAGFCAVAFASCAVNVFNDFIDRNRDKKIWPARAIPGGRVRPGEALALALAAASVSLAITWLAFNPTVFILMLAALILGWLYSAYLRDRVGYLSLPPIVGLVYLGGWAAFSPDTLLHSFLPWYLFVLGTVWQAAHIMVYYPLHITPGEKAPPAFFFRPSPQTAVLMGLLFTALTVILAACLIFYATYLGAIYLIIVLAAGIFAFVMSFRLLKNVHDRKACFKAFTALSLFRFAISLAILLSVMVFLI